jgi:hypothetical protein
MTWIARTLWDLVAPRAPNEPRAPAAPARRPARGKRRSRVQDRYDALVVEMKRAHGITVRKWRRSSSGVAWELRYRDGRTARCIAAPYPRGPMSCAIFLHEVGHHAIGLGIHRPRCLEEYRAWQWALEQMRGRGFTITAAVERRVRQSLHYAVCKAQRRGLRALPPELLPYAEEPSPLEMTR